MNDRPAPAILAPERPRATRPRRAIWAVVLIVLIALGAILAAYPRIERFYFRQAGVEDAATLRLATQVLRGALERTQALPALIADRPILRQLLAEPGNEGLLPFTNELLRQSALSLDVSDIYVLDITGPMEVLSGVKLFKDGQEFKMSKRAGTFVTLRDVVDAVGPDVTRFMLLTRKNDQGFDFDLDKALEQSKDNPIFYVQYANARICSTLRKAEEAGIATNDAVLAAADLAQVSHPSQLAVIKKLAEWPRQIEIAARTNEPHRVAFYLYDLASELHGLYHLGKTEHGLRFVNESSETATHANLALARSVSIVISAGLGILGVKPAQEMR